MPAVNQMCIRDRRYRMIDFVLSNMANAGVDNVSVIVRKNYHSLKMCIRDRGYTAWCNYLATHTAWDRRNTYAGENPLYILGS